MGLVDIHIPRMHRDATDHKHFEADGFQHGLVCGRKWEVFGEHTPRYVDPYSLIAGPQKCAT